MPRKNTVLFRSLSLLRGSEGLVSLRANLDDPTGAQRNGRSVFSHLSTVPAVAVLLASIVLGACGGGNSTKAVAPAITMNPASVTVTAGAAATFSAAATGQPAPTIQWQVSTNGGAT